MQTNPDQFRPGYNPEDPGEGAIPRKTQLDIVTVVGYIIVAAMGFFALLFIGIAAISVIVFHEYLGLTALLPGLPLVWAFIVTLRAANEIAKGDLS